MQTHFSLEERYMTKLYAEGGYAEEQAHKDVHRAFARDFAAFKEGDPRETGPPPRSSPSSSGGSPTGWLGHIAKNRQGAWAAT